MNIKIWEAVLNRLHIKYHERQRLGNIEELWVYYKFQRT